MNGADNIHYILAGRKRVTLYPPSATRFLYQKPWRGQPPAESEVGSAIDVDHERFPLFIKAQEQAVTLELERGEAVYIPMGWWHEIE